MKKIGKILKAPIEKYKGLKKGIKRIICLVLAVIVALAGVSIWKGHGLKFWELFGDSAETSAKASGESIVRRGNLTNSITGSGTVEPIEQREIVPEVKGKILEAPFNEGDSVMEGDVLYRFEMTAAENAIESALNNVEKAQTNLSNKQSNLEKVRENISKLTIKATASGKISGLSLRLGETVQGKVCTVTNFKEQTATIPFSSAHINKISVGDEVDVAVDKYMINTSGTVVRKYTAPDTLASGAVVYFVEIRLSNDYIVEENVNVTATVKSGNISSVSYGSVKYADPVTVNAEQKGEVSKINFKNGDWVEEGQVIAVLKNKDLDDDLRNAQQSVNEAKMNYEESLNNLEDKQEEANEYIVTSPINGVVLTKDYFVGDTISGQNPPSLMVVADMSKMKFTISADELDIAKIQLGQSVSVTADALTGQRLRGTITAVSKLGTASNGVTNYPIEVTIDRPGDLMPGMNVSAQIIVEQSYNALYLPVEAVEFFDGKYYVTVIGEVENMPEPSQQQGFRGWGNREEATGTSGEGNEEGGKPVAHGNGSTEGQRPGRGNWGNRGTEGTEEGGKSVTPENGGTEGQRPGRGNWGNKGAEGTEEGGKPVTPENGSTEGQRPGRGNLGNKDSESTQPSGEKKETASSTAEKDNRQPEKQEEKTDKNNNKETGTDTKSRQGQNGNRQPKQEDLKIKYYDKEKRVEVKIGIRTDNAYEILEGVEYGKVVKNTVQITQSGARSGGFGGGGFGGGNFGGGFGGGFSGGGNNRGNWGNRNNRNTGGRR